VYQIHPDMGGCNCYRSKNLEHHYYLKMRIRYLYIHLKLILRPAAESNRKVRVQSELPHMISAHTAFYSASFLPTSNFNSKILSTPLSNIICFNASYQIFTMDSIADSSSNAKRIYSPLADFDDIRVICLQPCTAGETIKCTIRHIKLSSEAHYEALSYMWGPQDFGTIEINSELCEVRVNL
jgi:hypothetical protein